MILCNVTIQLTRCDCSVQKDFLTFSKSVWMPNCIFPIIKVLKKFQRTEQQMKYERTNSMEFWSRMLIDDEKNKQISIYQ